MPLRDVGDARDMAEDRDDGENQRNDENANGRIIGLDPDGH
jgi:hypothetical protein